MEDAGAQDDKLDVICQRLGVVAGRLSLILSKVAELSDAFAGVTHKLENHGSAVETMSRAVTGLRTAVAGVLDTMQVRSPAIGSDEEEGSDAGDVCLPPTDASDDTIEPVLRPPGAAAAADVAGHTKIRKVGSKDRDVKTASLANRATESARAAARAMDVAVSQMVRVRQKLSELVTQSIGRSLTSAAVYMDAVTYSGMIKSTVQEVINGDDAAVADWLSSYIMKPTKSRKRKKATGKEAHQKVRAETPLKAVLPHTIEALKKRALLAYFKQIEANMDKLSKRQVLSCLAKNNYTNSDGGRKGICAAMVSMYSFLGALDRVHERDVVAGRVVHASVGFYALASCFVRYFLECVKAGTVNKPRTGTDPGWYVRWRAELLRVHTFLENDNEVHNGLALTDGPDSKRASISTEEDEQVKIWYGRQIENEVNYPAWLAQAIKQEELEKRQEEERQRQQLQQHQQQR